MSALNQFSTGLNNFVNTNTQLVNQGVNYATNEVLKIPNNVYTTYMPTQGTNIVTPTTTVPLSQSVVATSSIPQITPMSNITTYDTAYNKQPITYQPIIKNETQITPIQAYTETQTQSQIYPVVTKTETQLRPTITTTQIQPIVTTTQTKLQPTITTTQTQYKQQLPTTQVQHYPCQQQTFTTTQSPCQQKTTHTPQLFTTTQAPCQQQLFTTTQTHCRQPAVQHQPLKNAQYAPLPNSIISYQNVEYKTQTIPIPVRVLQPVTYQYIQQQKHKEQEYVCDRETSYQEDSLHDDEDVVYEYVYDDEVDVEYDEVDVDIDVDENDDENVYYTYE